MDEHRCRVFPIPFMFGIRRILSLVEGFRVVKQI